MGEVGLWIREKIAAFFGWLGRIIRLGFLYLWETLTTLSGGTLRRLLSGLVLLLLLYYVIGMQVMHRIDDRADIAVDAPAGGSQAVATVAFLIDREVNRHYWVANDPFFMPSWPMDNMSHFQRGLVSALSRFTFELRDQLGRTRGSSAADDDLEEAASEISKDPTQWWYDISKSLIPQQAAEAHYRRAYNALIAYNNRLASGDATFERRSDNLLETLNRVALDIGNASALLAEHVAVRAGRPLPDYQSDDLFYNVKGRLYAYYLLLKALKRDFPDVVSDKELGSLYDELLASFEVAARLQPLMVMNATPDGFFFPNHLTAQGFYLLRARTQLREVTNILLK